MHIFGRKPAHIRIILEEKIVPIHHHCLDGNDIITSHASLMWAQRWVALEDHLGIVQIVSRHIIRQVKRGTERGELGQSVNFVNM